MNKALFKLMLLSMKNLWLLSGLLLSIITAYPQNYKTKNVVLVTLDGYRWQELFYGIDQGLLNSEFTHEKDALSKDFNDADLRKQTALLNPFFSKTMEENGILLGNRDKKSKVNCTNNMWFSYPGYNEILTGKADDQRLTSNDKIDNPNVTFLEALNQTAKYKGRVAAFCSWDVFPFIINKTRSDIYVNAGYDTAWHSHLTESEKDLNKLQQETRGYWENVRFDAFTHGYAMEYIKTKKPRIVYIAYGETDDWAHEGEYDKYIRSAYNTNLYLSEIWTWIQSDPFYKDKTTMIITTDHGRGTVPLETWKDHGEKIEGADQIWVAAIGPDINPKAKTKGQFYQDQVAGTIMLLLGQPWEEGGKAFISIIK